MPLATTELPELADLAPFWLTVEEAIRALSPSLNNLGSLRRGHIRQLAPVVLGAKGWQHYASESWATWAEFKLAINAEFGLSKEQLNARFYALRLGEEEDAASFVIRVEQERKALGASKEATVHSFVPRLP